MPLTPEDVLNKHFTATQFRRGYDEQEVDDFLDEVVVELRRLSGENADLRRSGGGAAGAPAADPAAVEQAVAAEKEAQARVVRARAEAERAEQESQARIAAAQERAQQAEAQAQEAAAGATRHEEAPAATPGAQDAAGVIALAQKVHDEYVEQGRQEHDRLVTEGTTRRDTLFEEAQTTHDRLLGEGQARHDELVETAQARHDELISTGRSEHDRLVAEAQQENERLLTSAREQHDELVRTGRDENERLISEAQLASTGMVEEARTQRDTMLGELERSRSTYAAKISELRTFEEQYRSRLTDFIEGHLRGIQGAPSPVPGEAPDPSVQAAFTAEAAVSETDGPAPTEDAGLETADAMEAAPAHQG